MNEFSIKDIAEILEVSTVTVNSYILSDKLKAKKKYHGVRFKWVVCEDDFNFFKNMYFPWIRE